MVAIKHLREEARKRLLSSPFLSKNTLYTAQDAMIDIDVLLCFLLKTTRAHLLAHLDEKVSTINDIFIKFIEERYKGTSIAYIIEEKEFYGLHFYVNNSVLIPKSDTETLVENAIERLKSLHQNKHNKFGMEEIMQGKLKVLDVFSGSGCVGIAVLYSLHSHFNIHCSFLDISKKAIDISKHNAEKLLPNVVHKNIEFFLHDATENFPLHNGKKYDLIVANPPYVPNKQTEELLKDGRDEPPLALDGGEDGFKFFYSLAKNAYLALEKEGFLLCEIGDGQAETVAKIFVNAGFKNATFYQDLSRKTRVVEVHKIE